MLITALDLLFLLQLAVLDLEVISKTCGMCSQK